MSKKLIFFDIDGTLLDEEKQLPKSTKESIAKLQEMGHDVAIATGRAPFMFQSLLEELNIHTYVSLNGQYVVYKGKPIYTNPLNNQDLTRLSEIANERKNPVVYEDQNGMFSTMEFHEYIDIAIGSLKINIKPKFEPDYYKDKDIYQALLFCIDEEEPIYKENCPSLEFVRWHEYSVDVKPKGGSKANGINALINYLNISMDNVYAFGDGLNDLEMFKAVKNTVAMGNAHEKVKEVAKYITAHVNDDGIYKGLQQVGLL